MIQQLLEAGVLLLLLTPLFLSMTLGLSLLLRMRPPEAWVKQISTFYFLFNVGLVLVLLVLTELQPKTFFWSYPLFFRYKIDIVLSLERFPLLYLALSSVLMGLVGRFSFTYLHREEGFHRFFVLLLFATFGIHLILVAGCVDVLWIGWECLGLSSILLVAFFQDRKGPVQNGLYIFVVYRVGDLALLAIGLWLHSNLGTTHYQQIMTPENLARLQTGTLLTPAFFLGLLLVVSAVIKAGLLPFMNWLPRAMEGPTPSSAIFYGALSTHIGVFLLILFYPLLRIAPGMLPLIIVLGTLSAVLGSLFGRVQADAKNALAYSTIVQLGLIFIEIGFGWIWLAKIHLFSHAILRSYQFLKVPSVLHIHHEMVSLYGKDFSPTGWHLERLFPTRIQQWLYIVSLERGFLDLAMEKFVIRPIAWLAQACHRLEERWLLALLQQPPSELSALKASHELSSSVSSAEKQPTTPPTQEPVP